MVVPVVFHEGLVRRTDNTRYICPHGHDDILNTAIGRPDHGGCVRATGFGVTITQYYGRASRGSNSSFTSITQQQLAEIIGNLKEE